MNWLKCCELWPFLQIYKSSPPITVIDEKRRFNHLLKIWKRSGVKDLEDEQLDFLNSEIYRFKCWDRKSRLQHSRLNNLLRKFNDRLEEVLKEKGLL